MNPDRPERPQLRILARATKDDDSVAAFFVGCHPQPLGGKLLTRSTSNGLPYVYLREIGERWLATPTLQANVDGASPTVRLVMWNRISKPSDALSEAFVVLNSGVYGEDAIIERIL
ncbi:hypothetical protein [Cellulosimicrobium sp. SJTW-1]|uniref:hypothetical protein n=1 Tax=Cellulosimicrobium sp. SJTW-1 TaxID=3078082 RepID=UPI0039EBB7E9